MSLRGLVLDWEETGDMLVVLTILLVHPMDNF
jgi:hypothetical protein